MNENSKKLFSATATPLASIFGSGFLVIVPILNGAVGPYAWLAMACVCGLAYAMGSVIRFNIRNAEPLMEDGTAPHRAMMFEKTSDLALVVAYAISVCLYIRILAAFLLGGLGIDTPLNEHVVTGAVISIIGLIGYTKGLDMLQNLEKIALGVTLIIIVALLAGFAFYDVNTLKGPGIQLPKMPDGTADFDYKGGLGDISLPLMFSPVPKPGQAYSWGVGPTFQFPTHTSSELGTKTWEAGPAKKAIVEFVAAVTDEKGRDYVEPAKSMARGSTRPYTQDSMTRGMLVLVPNISTIPS